MERRIGLPAAMLLIVNSGANHSKNQKSNLIVFPNDINNF
jgi:hypothetical protein